MCVCEREKTREQCECVCLSCAYTDCINNSDTRSDRNSVDNDIALIMKSPVCELEEKIDRKKKKPHQI